MILIDDRLATEKQDTLACLRQSSIQEQQRKRVVMKHGTSCICSICKRKHYRAVYMREWSKKHRLYYSLLNRKWREKNREYVFKKKRIYAKKNKESYREYRRKWRLQNSNAVKAHYLFNKFLKSSKMSRPEKCCKCGKRCKPLAHHPDYSRPMDVVWLCNYCHGDILSQRLTKGRIK